MGTRATPRRCAFCGSRKSLTKEHVLPQWLKPIVPFEGKTGVEFATGERRTLPISPSERTAKAFCRSCNTGWMNDLEGAAKPLLTPMILGERRPRKLKRLALQTIATWAAKTAVTCQYVNPPERRFVQQRARREMYETKVAPIGTHVWLAPHDGDLFNAIFSLEPINIQFAKEIPEVDDHGLPKVHSYSGSIGLGSVFIHVLYLAGVEIPLKECPDFGVPRIWPYSHPITWPTTAPLSNIEICKLMGVLPRTESEVEDLLGLGGESSGGAPKTEGHA